MAKKYLDQEGLKQVWAAIKAKFIDDAELQAILSQYLKTADAEATFETINDFNTFKTAIETRLGNDEEAFNSAIADLLAKVDKKVDREVDGTNGKSLIFNEADGGGSKFEGANGGAVAYVGTHDNIGGEIGAQIYVDKNATGTESTIIDITKNGAFYTKGTLVPAKDRDVEANELVTKKDLISVEVPEYEIVGLVPNDEGLIGLKLIYDGDEEFESNETIPQLKIQNNGKREIHVYP